MRPTLWLGTHLPTWLWRLQDIPLFVSHRALEGRKSSYPPATTTYALDSGAFSELDANGNWDRVSPRAYLRAVTRYAEELGPPAWAAQQDWMCEPPMLKRTGLTIQEHQRRTVDNYLELRTLGSSVPIVPVIQGWRLEDYLRCVEMYIQASVDLTKEPLVGVGSVCRRQHTSEIGAIVSTLANLGINIHGFGVKIQGLIRYASYLVSTDSMAWSYDGRLTPTRCGSNTHKNEANCVTFALDWRLYVLMRTEMAA